MPKITEIGVDVVTGLRLKFRNGEIGILLNDLNKIILKDGFLNNPVGAYKGDSWDLVAVYERPFSWKDVLDHKIKGRKVWDESVVREYEALIEMKEKVASKEVYLSVQVEELESMRESIKSIERVIRESLNNV